jgi:hypothetical protein
MAVRNRIAHSYGRGTRAGASESVAGTLVVAAGYGIAVSVFMVLTIESMFGASGPVTRLAVLASTVTVLVVGAGLVCARRSSGRRRPGRG